MKNNNLLIAISFLTMAIFLNGCQRDNKNVIVGTWQICGMSSCNEEPVCSDEQGDRIVFQSNGLIKDKEGLYDNEHYQLVGDTSLWVGASNQEHKVKFYNNYNNMIVYEWVCGSPNSLISTVHNINLKKVR